MNDGNMYAMRLTSGSTCVAFLTFCAIVGKYLRNNGKYLCTNGGDTVIACEMRQDCSTPSMIMTCLSYCIMKYRCLTCAYCISFRSMMHAMHAHVTSLVYHAMYAVHIIDQRRMLRMSSVDACYTYYHFCHNSMHVLCRCYKFYLL